MPDRARIAIAGAGIYGATAAIRLAERGHEVSLFDPLGIVQAASAINQYRVHAGYHYPRSPETIMEVQSARTEFLREFAPAVVQNSAHFYAIPRFGSLTTAHDFEAVMHRFGLPFSVVQPDWIDFDFIQRCWSVNEAVYDVGRLRQLIEERLLRLGVSFVQRQFQKDESTPYDFVVWATYGQDQAQGMLKSVRKQVAEKILVRLPAKLRNISLVVIDGPFTAFDPYGSGENSLFGSALHTNHWSSDDPSEPIPDSYSGLLHLPDFRPYSRTRFDLMREDCVRTVPATRDAEYLGSRFVIRVVENNPKTDQRTLYVRKMDTRNIQIFSGKVVGAVKAAQMVVEHVEA